MTAHADRRSLSTGYTEEEILECVRRSISLVELRDERAGDGLSDAERTRRAQLAVPPTSGQAHQHYPPAPGEPWTALRLSESVEEKAEQLEVMKVFRACGCTPCNTSQARASKMHPGFPDLFVFGPPATLLSFFFETKRQVGGWHSPAQVDFAQLCTQTNTRHYAGDRYDAMRVMIQLGLAEYSDGVFQPVRRSA